MNDQRVHMVGTDGGLRTIPSYLVDELTKKGWKLVINPKRNYYPEYDQTSPFYKRNVNTTPDIADILLVEVL